MKSGSVEDDANRLNDSAKRSLLSAGAVLQGVFGDALFDFQHLFTGSTLIDVRGQFDSSSKTVLDYAMQCADIATL
jgi:hypothetical protein